MTKSWNAKPTISAPLILEYTNSYQELCSLTRMLWKQFGILNILLRYGFWLCIGFAILVVLIAIPLKAQTCCIDPKTQEFARLMGLYGASVSTAALLFGFTVHCLVQAWVMGWIGKDSDTIRLGLSPDAIESISVHSRSIYSWSGVRRIEQTREATFLMVGGFSGIIIPHACLHEKIKPEDFLRLLKSWKSEQSRPTA